MLQVGSPCGLCNRLDVIITGYVLAKARGEEEIEVLWPVNVQMPATFHDLFTRLPGGRVTECNVDARIWQDYHAAIDDYFLRTIATRSFTPRCWRR